MAKMKAESAVQSAEQAKLFSGAAHQVSSQCCNAQITGEWKTKLILFFLSKYLSVSPNCFVVFYRQFQKNLSRVILSSLKSTEKYTIFFLFLLVNIVMRCYQS